MLLEIMIMFADYGSKMLQGYEVETELNIKSQCHTAFFTAKFNF